MCMRAREARTSGAALPLLRRAGDKEFRAMRMRPSSLVNFHARALVAAQAIQENKVGFATT